MNKKKKTSFFSLTAQLSLVMLCSAILAVLCAAVMYLNRFPFYAWATKQHIVEDRREEYKVWFLEQAVNCRLKPKGVDEADREAYDEKYVSFLQNTEKRGKYIGVYIHDKDTGEYITGYYPALLSNHFWASWLWSDADIFSQSIQPVKFEAKFADCQAEVMLYSYEIMQVLPLYVMAGVILCVLLFLVPVLIFVHRRLKYLGKVRKEVLVMAEGDLDHPLTVKGKDEITSLAEELDQLRVALGETIEQERKSHMANQELIRAISHDLRTPLTTLYGYLEILKNGKGKSEKYPEYIQRCLEKTEEIKGMSDKMFEYALVFSGVEQVDKKKFSANLLQKAVFCQTEDLKAQGFLVCEKREKDEISGDEQLFGNPFLLNRLLGNLFSNIQRYGNPKNTVIWQLYRKQKQICFSIKNQVLDHPCCEGSGVGLKSAEKIARLHGGELNIENRDGIFQVYLCLPLYMERA